MATSTIGWHKSLFVTHKHRALSLPLLPPPPPPKHTHLGRRGHLARQLPVRTFLLRLAVCRQVSAAFPGRAPQSKKGSCPSHGTRRRESLAWHHACLMAHHHLLAPRGVSARASYRGRHAVPAGSPCRAPCHGEVSLALAAQPPSALVARHIRGPQRIGQGQGVFCTRRLVAFIVRPANGQILKSVQRKRLLELARRSRRRRPRRFQRLQLIGLRKG